MAIETLGAAIRQMNRLWADGTVTGFTDAELLERFVSGHDPEVFEALVGRHGPMVLGVCQGILRDPHDAEDAFQATFLILVKKSTTLRGHVALGPWLYQSRTAWRSGPMPPPFGGAHAKGGRGRWLGQRQPRGRRSRTSSCGHSMKRSLFCRRSSAKR